MNKSEERREQSRHPVNAPVRLRDARSADSGFLCSLKDASRSGVALVLDRQPEVGSSIQLEILTANGERVEPELPARVVYTTPQDDGSFHVGCEFRLPDNAAQ